MEPMLHMAFALRSTIGEASISIIDKLVCCSLAGIELYMAENDLPHGCLSAKDMILWPEWSATVKSKSLKQLESAY